MDKDIASLRVGVETTISPVLVVEPLAEVGKFIPGLQVDLIYDAADPLAEALLSGAIHAALASGWDRLPDRLDRGDCWKRPWTSLTRVENSASA